jgi:predicted ATPase
VERHQTLRATVDWSYSLLGPGEQAVFDRLGCSPPSFARGGVRSPPGMASRAGTCSALSGLVNKSMVATVAAGGRPLPTARDDAPIRPRRLDQAGASDRCRRAHAEHCAQFAERMSEAFYTAATPPHVCLVDSSSTTTGPP